ncbi:MAG: hypothetical protein P8N63_02120, partial [Pseudomonadales bacterium]|nr:hypothetical protein [Pseudomonadales bacterium]
PTFGKRTHRQRHFWSKLLCKQISGLHIFVATLHVFVATLHVFVATLHVFVAALTIVTTSLKHFEPALFLQYNLNSAELF